MENFRFDATTRAVTGFNSWRELLNSHESYRPTIMPRDRQHIDLADAFDAAMADRGSERRAWRGGGTTSATVQLSPEGRLAVRLQGVPVGSGLAADWLRVIWRINDDSKDARDGKQWIGSTLTTSTGEDGAWIEEYADFRVTLRHTEWNSGENTGTIEAKTPEAAIALANAVRQVTGQQVR